MFGEHVLGEASSEESSSEGREDAESHADLMAIFGLPAKEGQRSPKQLRLEDLTSRQLAVALTNVAPALNPSDLLEIGAQADARL